MDAFYRIYNRSTLTFIDAISMTGGIMTITILVFSVLMSKIESFYYFVTLIENILYF